jgi:hypothetical protein
MLKQLFRTTAVFVLTVSFGLSAIPASADGVGDVMGTSTVTDASAAIKHAMDKAKQQDPKKALQAGSVAQVPPVTQSPVGGQQQQGLPTGFTYTADITAALPFGNIGNNKKFLPGGTDLVAGYGFNPTTRFVASFYQLQHYPVGFNSGNVPLYLQGFQNPIGCVNLGGTTSGSCAGIPSQLNLETKDSFLLFNLEKLFAIHLPHNRVLPIVITPTYVSRWSTIGASGSGNDIVPFEPNVPNGYAITNVNTRTAQVWSVAATVPFLKTSKMFGTFTVAPSWLDHLNGINQVNHAQLYQIAYLEYTPTNRLKFFLEPQSSRDYLPTDPYAQHLIAYFAGVSQRIGNDGFVQVILNSGSPTNEGSDGVTALTCQALPCGSNAVVPTIGGLKASQLQVQLGVGSPSVIQF